MGMLMILFLIPWLEGSGLDFGAASPARRLRLEAPWSLFYLGLAAAGVINFLPTRYGPAAVLLGIGLGLEFAGLARFELDASWRGRLWSAVPVFFAAAIWSGYRMSRPSPLARSDLERLWFWFRDHWGVVWSLRILERYNRAASATPRGLRLTWHGLDGQEPKGSAVFDATALLAGLLRRFADAERIGHEAVKK